MPNRKPDDEVVASALGRSADCLPVEELEAILYNRASARAMGHVERCTHCRSELQMLRSFVSGELSEDERAPVAAISARLKAQSSEIVRRRTAVEEIVPWWRRIFAVPWLAPAAGALAGLLVVAGIALQFRESRQPPLELRGARPEVLRSTAFSIQSPVGDIPAKPPEISWQAVSHAAHYRIQLSEVDDTEVWTGESNGPRIQLPLNVENLIVPAKTFLIRVTAFDAAGAQIGASEPVRFRLLQKLYKQ